LLYLPVFLSSTEERLEGVGNKFLMKKWLSWQLFVAAAVDLNVHRSYQYISGQLPNE
jgi:hypothetical protein